MSSKLDHKHRAQCSSPTRTPRTNTARPATTGLAVVSPSQTRPSTPAQTDKQPFVVATPSTPITPETITTVLQSPTHRLDLESENAALKKELSELKLQLQAVVNHSIESDQRLLQFTSDIFTWEASTPSNSRPTSQPDPTDIETQPERATPDVPGRISVCRSCQAYKKEAAEMTCTLEKLELDNKALKRRIETLLTAPASPLTVHNSFEALSDLDDQDETGFTVVRRSRICTRGTSRNIKRISNRSNKQELIPKNKRVWPKRTPVPFKNVTVVGDSHSRHLSANLRMKTTDHTNIVGLCKPGAGLLHMAPSSTPPVNNCYILVAGTNDLAAGREDIVYHHMEEVIGKCRESSSVLVLPLPPRHDLPPVSPVHESIVLANNYISELCERYDGVTMLDMSELSRKHFTAHGLHLTAMGKSFLADLIVRELAALPRRCVEDVVKRTSTDALRTPPSPARHQHNSYAEAVVNRPTAQLSTPVVKKRQTDSDLQNRISGFLGTPPTGNGLN